MGLTRLAVARARARGGLLLAVAATVALVVAAGVLVLGSLTQAMRTIVADAVASAPDEDRVAVLRIPVTDAGQHDLAAELLAARFGASLRVTAPPRDTGVTAEWTLEADPARLDPWAVPAIADDLAFLDRDARHVDGLAPQGASVEGGLGDLLEGTAPSVLAVVAVAPVPVVLVVVAGLIAVLQLARLLGASRAVEHTTLRARGLSQRQAARMSTGELTLVALGGALAGAAAGALAVAALAGGWPALGAAVRTTWPVPVVATLVLGPLAGRAASRPAPPGRRAHRVAAGVAALLVTAAAAVFVWMLGQPSEGAWSFAVAAVAPALALGAAGLVVLAAFPSVATAVAGLAERRTGLAPALPARTVARSTAGFGVVVVLVALAAGGAVLAGASAQTWAVAQRSSAQFAAGADARADWGAPRVVPADVSQVAGSAGVDAAGAVVSQRARAGDSALALIALPPAPVVPDVADLADPWRMLPAGPVGEVLPEGAADLVATFAIRATGAATPTGWDPEREEPFFEPRPLPELALLEGTARLLDAHGTPASAPMTLRYDDVDDPAQGTLTASGALPDGAAPWTLVGVSVGYPTSTGANTLEIVPRAASAGGRALPVDAMPQTVDRDRPTAALLFAEPDDRVDGVVTAALADRLGLDEGDTLTLRFERSPRRADVRVAGVVDAVPGTDDPLAVAVRLDALSQALFAAGLPLDADQLWATGPGAREAVSAVPGRTTIVTGAAQAGPIPALTAVWWVSAIATALLAAIAVVSASLALARQRAVEAFVLRALGVTPARQARWRRAELAVVAAGAFVAGGLLGVAVAALTVPALTRTAVPGVLPVFAERFALQPWPPLVVAVVLAAAVALAAVLVGAAIAAQARAGRVREAA